MSRQEVLSVVVMSLQIFCVVTIGYIIQLVR